MNLDPNGKYKTKAGDAVVMMQYRPRTDDRGAVDMFPWKITVRDKSGKLFTNWYMPDGKWTSEQSTELDLVEA